MNPPSYSNNIIILFCFRDSMFKCTFVQVADAVTYTVYILKIILGRFGAFDCESSSFN